MAICCIKEPGFLYYVVINNKERTMQREVFLLKETTKTSTSVPHDSRISFFYS